MQNHMLMLKVISLKKGMYFIS